jgi:hypothetical protein
MEKTNQSSNQEITFLYSNKKRVKKDVNILDKASRYFEIEIAHKYGYKIIKFIDVKGTRFVVAEKEGCLYVISLIIVRVKNKVNPEELIPYLKIIQTTRLVAEQYMAIAASSLIELK